MYELGVRPFIFSGELRPKVGVRPDLPIPVPAKAAIVVAPRPPRETPALIPAPPMEEAAAEEEREEVPYIIPRRHVEKKTKVVEREVIPPIAEPSSSSRRPALPAVTGLAKWKWTNLIINSNNQPS